MKIRSGFVSNSSSSSFMIFGICMKDVEPDYADTDEGVDEQIEDDEVDLYELCDEHGLSLYHSEDENNGEADFVGVDPSEMKNDETLKEFKKRVSTMIKKALGKRAGKKIKCDFHCGVYAC